MYVVNWIGTPPGLRREGEPNRVIPVRLLLIQFSPSETRSVYVYDTIL